MLLYIEYMFEKLVPEDFGGEYFNCTYVVLLL